MVGQLIALVLGWVVAGLLNSLVFHYHHYPDELSSIASASHSMQPMRTSSPAPGPLDLGPPHSCCQGQLYCFSCATLTTGLALVCCPNGKQRLLSHALQLVRVRASSPTFCPQGQLSHLLQVLMGEGSIFPSPMPPHGRQGGSRSTPLLSCSQGWLNLCPQPHGLLECASCPGEEHTYGEGLGHLS